MTAFVPATAATNCAVKVAMPERRWRKFKAVRSAVSTERASPAMLATDSPAMTCVPSSTSESN